MGCRIGPSARLGTATAQLVDRGSLAYGRQRSDVLRRAAQRPRLRCLDERPREQSEHPRQQHRLHHAPWQYLSELVRLKGTGPLDVEVGWVSTGGANPRAYFEYVTASGADSGAMQSSSVTKNTYQSFKVSAPGSADGNGNYTWTAYLGTTSFNSVLLPFHIGTLRTNSERKNSCDTM